jgi:hypothetical protein
MWDTWAAWEPTAEAHLVSRTTELPADERDDAISAAAHRLLIVRYDNAVGASASLNQFDSLSSRLCIDPAGAGYKPVNPPLQTALAYISMKDPNRWQPLDLEVRFTQSGQAESDTLQSLIDPPLGLRHTLCVGSLGRPDANRSGPTPTPHLQPRRQSGSSIDQLSIH